MNFIKIAKCLHCCLILMFLYQKGFSFQPSSKTWLLQERRSVFKPLMKVYTNTLKAKSTKQDKETRNSKSKNASEDPHYRVHYPSAGSMFDITQGPGHHLINVDHNKLDDMGDKTVNVNEMKLDAVTVTFFSFTFLALCVFVFVFVDGGVGLIARFQNAMI